MNANFTPEMIGYIKRVVIERGISKEDMTKELMREIILAAQARMNKMIDDVLDGAGYGSERYRVAMQYTAGRIYFS